MGNKPSKRKKKKQHQNKSNISIPTHLIDALRNTQINQHDVNNLIVSARKQKNILNPFIIIISTADKVLHQVLIINRNIKVIHCSTHANVKRRIAATIQNIFDIPNPRHDGLIVVLVCVICVETNDKLLVPQFYYDQKQAKRHIAKLKKDILFRLDQKVVLEYSKCQIFNPPSKHVTTRPCNISQYENDYFHVLKQKKHLHNIKCVLKQINQQSFNIDQFNIRNVLRDYIKLITSADMNDIASINAELQGVCSADKCILLRRQQDHTTAFQQILQKMHCFCVHGYDIGYILTSDEWSFIGTDQLQATHVHCNHVLQSQVISKMHQILFKKHSALHQMKFMKQRIEKYNQITPLLCNDELSDCKDNNMFNFGRTFVYKEETKLEESSSHSSSTNSDIIYIEARFHNLKTELIDNISQCLSISQFNEEYKKAELHAQSTYRKETYSDMTMDHILALMVYCNFTDLQHAFTETYWKINKHKYFYHLGRFIKQSIHEFGETVQQEKSIRFFHGMSQKLAFPSFINNVQINCPLSTSSQLPVAVSFTNLNSGLIIEVGESRTKKIGFVRELSLAWLSDYANESEHLFIQNESPLWFIDILDASKGFQYKTVLNALRMIDAIVSMGSAFIDDKLLPLAMKIIDQQLAIFNDYYAIKIIQTYFKNKKRLVVNFKNKNKECFTRLHDSFFYDQYEFEWINIWFIATLFHNIELIEVENIKLSPTIIDAMLKDLEKIHQNTKLARIAIKCISSPYEQFSISYCILQYQHKFKALNFQLIKGKHINRIYVDKVHTEEKVMSELKVEKSQDSMGSSGTEVNLNCEMDDCYRTVRNWLENTVCFSSTNSQIYAKLFIENGFDDMESLNDINMEELKELDVKMGHRKKILKCLQQRNILQNINIDPSFSEGLNKTD